MSERLLNLEPIWIAGPAHREAGSNVHREAGSNVHREFDLQLETLINDPKVESLLRQLLIVMREVRFQDIRALIGDSVSTMDLITYYIDTRLDGDWRNVGCL